MGILMRKLTPLLALALFLAPLLHAQTWVPVAHEGDAISVTSATVRYGTPNCTPTPAVPCWIQLSVSGKFIANNAFFKTDPAPNVVKELDVLQTSAAQVVTVNGKPVTVPAALVVVVTPPVTSKTCSVPAQTIPVTINSDGSFVANLTGLVVTCK